MLISISSKETLENFPYYSYVYLIQHRYTKKMYIGVRYCSMETRFHFIAIYDLRHYQTSSRDVLFKTELSKYPDNFEYFIIETFEEYNKARAYEAQLQQIFDAANNPLYYNMTNSDFTEGSKYDGIQIYDLQEEKIITITSHKDFCINVWDLLSGQVNIVQNRYCKLDDMLSDNIQTYKTMNEDITLYVYNYSTETTNKICVKRNMGSISVGPEFPKLISNDYLNTSHNGFYINEDDCIRQNKIITLYKYNEYLRVPDIHWVRYKNIFKIFGCSNGVSSFIFDNKRASFRGYYKTIESYNLAYEQITAYKDIGTSTISQTVLRKDCAKYFGYEFSKVLNNKKLKSETGWYILKDNNDNKR